jgi:hypothetical protein
VHLEEIYKRIQSEQGTEGQKEIVIEMSDDDEDSVGNR